MKIFLDVGANRGESARAALDEKYGFDNKIEELKNNNKWIVKEFFKSDYIKSKDVNAWLCLAEVI